MKLPVVEVFQSIQGEGYFTGTPATFIRLAGCPLNCTFCDTDKEAKYEATPAQLVHAVEHSHVVITGGEPLIHDLTDLLRLLRPHTTQIETSGTRKFRTWQDNVWLTCSPKRGHPVRLKNINEFKFLVPMWNLEQIRYYWDKHPGKRFYAQPINYEKSLCMSHVQRAVWMCLNATFPLNLSIQLHKVIGIK